MQTETSIPLAAKDSPTAPHPAYWLPTAALILCKGTARATATAIERDIYYPDHRGRCVDTTAIASHCLNIDA